MSLHFSLRCSWNTLLVINIIDSSNHNAKIYWITDDPDGVYNSIFKHNFEPKEYLKVDSIIFIPRYHPMVDKYFDTISEITYQIDLKLSVEMKQINDCIDKLKTELKSSLSNSWSADFLERLFYTNRINTRFLNSKHYFGFRVSII